MYCVAPCLSTTGGRSRRRRVRPWNDESPQPPAIPVPDVLVVEESLAGYAPLRGQPLILGVFLGGPDVNAPAVVGISVGVLHHAILGTAHYPVGGRRLVELRVDAIQGLLLEAGRRQQLLRVVRLPPSDRSAARQTQDGRDAQRHDAHHGMPHRGATLQRMILISPGSCRHPVSQVAQGASEMLSGSNPGSGL